MAGSGKPKTGGRRKGTRNRRTVLLGTAMEAMRQENCNPLLVLAKAANGEIRSDLRVKAAAELAKYGWAQISRTELTGMEGGAIQHGPVQIVIDYGDAVQGETAEASSGPGESGSGGEEV